MIQLQEITLGYKKNATALNLLLETANAEFNDASLTALLGRNGAGKSTLLRAMAGLEPPLSGNIEVSGKDIYGMSAQERARSVAYVSTSRTRVAALKCRDAVAMGRAPYTGWTGRLSSEDNIIVDEALHQTGMDDYAARQLDTLSDGEWQRVMIARALAQQTPVMILDEPTSFLDIPNRVMLCRLLQTLAHDSNRCIIYSTHELHTALEMADNVALIADKKLYVTPSDDVSMRNRISTLFGVEV